MLKQKDKKWPTFKYVGKREEIRNSETFDQWNAALCSAFLSKKGSSVGQIQSVEPSAC